MGSNEKLSIDTGFKHLGLVSSDLDKLTIEFYDDSGSLLYTGYMDISDGKLKKKVTE